MLKHLNVVVPDKCPLKKRLTIHKIIFYVKFMKYIDLKLRAPTPVFTRQDLLLIGLKSAVRSQAGKGSKGVCSEG